MMAMLQLCAKIQRETDISGKRRSILGKSGLSVFKKNSWQQNWEAVAIFHWHVQSVIASSKFM